MGKTTLFDPLDEAVHQLVLREGKCWQFDQQLETANRYIGVDLYEPILDAARCRFATLIDQCIVDIRHCAPRSGVPRLC
jgi:hypothetical protein